MEWTVEPANAQCPGGGSRLDIDIDIDIRPCLDARMSFWNPRPRPAHARLDSVTLLRRPAKDAQQSRLSSLKNWRLALVACTASFVFLFGFHLLSHAKHGTSHFSAGSIVEEPTLQDLSQRPRNFGTFRDVDETDVHDIHLKEGNNKNPSNRLPQRSSRVTVPHIKITESLPSLENLPASSPLRLQWLAAIEDLENYAASELKKYRPSESYPRGVPGTGVSDTLEAVALQAYLDCASGHGQWVYDAAGSHLARMNASLPVHKHSSRFSKCDQSFYKHTDGTPGGTSWNVRSSLKWSWKADDDCKTLLADYPKVKSAIQSEAFASPPSRSTLCRLLAHKSILLIGDSPTQYLLHDLLLDYTNSRPNTCYGDLYCSMHSICSDLDLGRSFVGDEQVYDAIPDPLAYSDSESKTDNSQPSLLHEYFSDILRPKTTLLRYRRSDSFFMNSSPSHPRYSPVALHPVTGVREINMHSLADARRSDVVIVSKAPISVPALGHPGHDEIMTQISKRLQANDAHILDVVGNILQMSIVLTRQVWLPELLESLQAVRSIPATNLIVYRGGWRMQPQCAKSTIHGGSKTSEWPGAWDPQGDGPPPYTSMPTLIQLLGINNISDPAFVDVRITTYNLQTVLQNHIGRRIILPKFGIPFLDMETATSVWRAGFVGGAAVKRGTPASSSETSRADCLSMCLPSSGMALEELFIGSLMRLLGWGWASGDRAKTWIGNGFVPIRERKMDMQKQ
ncbi:hypothetical protein EMMF5_004206 [Cystobasidiomycetes sp. EMM_F5]